MNDRSEILLDPIKRNVSLKGLRCDLCLNPIDAASEYEDTYDGTIYFAFVCPRCGALDIWEKR